MVFRAVARSTHKEPHPTFITKDVAFLKLLLGKDQFFLMRVFLEAESMQVSQVKVLQNWTTVLQWEYFMFHSYTEKRLLYR